MKKILLGVLLFVIFLGFSAPPAFANTYKTSRKVAYTTTTKKYVAKRPVRTVKKVAYHKVNHTNVAQIPALEPWQVENGRTSAALQNQNAKVLVNWSVRGGTCNIRYGEKGMSYYQFRDSAGCDEGSHWVGALKPGQTYKFQIAQDNWSNWSGTAVAQAW